MTDRILILREANRSLAKLPARTQDRIDLAIDGLAEDPRPAGTVRVGATEPTYRIRMGDYRVLYPVDDAERVVTVVRVGHRLDVYRGI
jgi:mRNA interferase RelE/StbE